MGTGSDQHLKLTTIQPMSENHKIVVGKYDKLVSSST